MVIVKKWRQGGFVPVRPHSSGSQLLEKGKKKILFVGCAENLLDLVYFMDMPHAWFGTVEGFASPQILYYQVRSVQCPIWNSSPNMTMLISCWTSTFVWDLQEKQKWHKAHLQHWHTPSLHPSIISIPNLWNPTQRWSTVADTHYHQYWP